MARTATQIIDDIHAFRPLEGNWQRLDELLGELWPVGGVDRHVQDLLVVLERFPEETGAGALWSLVHAVESVPDYEPELIQSVKRQPSELVVTMVGRLLNSGISKVENVCLVTLLQSVVSSPDVASSVRASASEWVQHHANPNAADGG